MEEEMNMSSCYPTGCPPCTTAIDFPENPADGDKYCVVLDDTGKQKCWVWDKCVPGWRAEGQTDSPVRYRGGIDLTRTRASQYPDITAGDFFVVTVDADASTPANYPGLPSTVKAGERVVWSGNDWQVVTPIVAYAEEALGDVDLGDDGKPDPDTRIGGIVKNATLSQALAGTDKCDTITPYTLKGVVGDIPEFGSDDCPNDVDEEGPESVASWVPNSDTPTIACKTLAEGTTSFFGVGQIATAYSNDRDSYGDGYDTDWLTNAALAPIIDAILERLKELEENPGQAPSPIARLTRNYSQNATWTPIDPDNLVSIKVAMAGGAGGASMWNGSENCAGSGFKVFPDRKGFNGDDAKVWAKDYTAEEVGTSASIVIGRGGRGAPYPFSNTFVTSNSEAGSPSTFTPTGTSTATISAGSGAGKRENPTVNPSNGAEVASPMSGFDYDATTEFPRRPGGVASGSTCTGSGDNRDFNGGTGGPGANGFCVIYEYYPSNWVDPRTQGGFKL